MTEQQQYPTREQVVRLLSLLADGRAEYFHGKEPEHQGDLRAMRFDELIIYAEREAARHIRDIVAGDNDGRGWMPSWRWDDLDAVLALFPQPTPSAEPTALSMEGLLSEPCETFTQQSGMTCADDTARVLGSHYGATEYCWPCRLRAVYQPAPALLEPCCSRPEDPNWHTADGGHVVPPDVEEDTPVAPSSIADMAPGTTFTATKYPMFKSPVPRQLMVVNTFGGRRLVDREADFWSIESIDPSTIRDVTPPPHPGT